MEANSIRSNGVSSDWYLVDKNGASAIGRFCAPANGDNRAADRLAVAGLDTCRFYDAILLNANGVGIGASPKAQKRRKGSNRHNDSRPPGVFHTWGRIVFHIVGHTFGTP